MTIDPFPISVGPEGAVGEANRQGTWEILEAHLGNASIVLSARPTTGPRLNAVLFQTGTSNDLTLTLYIGDPDSGNQVNYKKE
ncbi:hypothetical protein [Subtercola boreus]|uniref:hypothetical protein n=1 Tax=Subtercola boreus TaxID=120213 RepID=UPI0011C04620|nr:hypothetical protein [Subtercola boreus]